MLAKQVPAREAERRIGGDGKEAEDGCERLHRFWMNDCSLREIARGFKFLLESLYLCSLTPTFCKTEIAEHNLLGKSGASI